MITYLARDMLYLSRREINHKGNEMNMYDVFFEGAFQGYTWADDELGAIVGVVGEFAYDGDGVRDYRYTAAQS